MSESRDVPSPCNGICELNAKAVCIGCGRSCDEIARWPFLPPSMKRTVRDTAAERLKAMPARPDVLGAER